MTACACCFVDPAVQPEITNRPGLSAIAYRIGTFASFRAALLDEISKTPELSALRTRLSDDYSITVLELWSVVGDILTFYQERIANEGFLRTATLRDSVLRLVRLIDYQLQPGLAATAWLAFTLEPGASVTIPTGLRVQSVAQGNAPPQKYETIQSIAADARFNSLRILPAPEIVLPLAPGRLTECFAPGADMAAFAATLSPGDRLVAYAPASPPEIEFLTVAGTAVQDDRSTVTWKIPPAQPDLSPAASGTSTRAGLFKVGRTFHLFGYNVPATYIETVLVDSNDPKSLRAQLADTPALSFDIGSFYLDGLYDGIKPGSTLLIHLTQSSGPDQIYYATVKSVSEGPTSRGGKSGVATLLSASADGFTPLTPLSVSIYELLGPQLRLLPAVFPDLLSSPDLYLSGRRNGWNTIEVGRTIVKGVIQPGVTVGVNDLQAGREIVLLDSDPTTAVSATVMGTRLIGDQITLGVAGNDVSTLTQLGLDSTHAQAITALISPPIDSDPIQLHNPNLQLNVKIGQHPTQTISLSPPLVFVQGTPSSLTSIATALTSAIQAALPDVPEFANAQAFAASTSGPGFLYVVAGTAAAPIAFAPTAADPDTVVDLGLDASEVNYLDGVLSGPLNVTATSGTLTVALEMLPAQVVSFPMFNNPAGGNGKTVSALIVAIQGQLNLEDPPLLHYLPSGQMLCFPPPARFARPSFLQITASLTGTINLDSSSALLMGNVAAASQGEKVVNEIVGNGDASAPFQTFSLLKKPVTFLLGNGPHGAESSLAVSVNGVQWEEVATLYGTGSNDEVFVTRVADDSTLTMEFGDGVTGSRLPTGLANIVANYRKGVGLAGRVGANTLTSLLDKANGVKRVTNPLAADGGADPQALDDARTNAPATVRTFGLAVSLEDFEDVALETGEIAKANATWIWTGLQKAIYLTVSAQNGEKLSPDGIQALWNTLLTHRDPNHQLFIGNFARVPITLTANLMVDPRYSAPVVQAAAFSALVEALSFDQLMFAEAIHLSAIYGVLQSVDGVTAVDITDLNLKSQDPGFRKAHGADSRKPQPHLFMLGARPGSGAGGSVLPAELAWVDVPTLDLVLTTGGSGS